jgi:hypothetical protein
MRVLLFSFFSFPTVNRASDDHRDGDAASVESSDGVALQSP